MGETTDQLREQVDKARDGATDKIIKLEQQVTDAAEHVKEQFDWRRQVDDRPLAAIGIALAGGALFGAMMGGHSNQHQQHAPYLTSNGQSASASSNSGLGGLIRKAAKNAGLEAKIEAYAQELFTSVGKRVGEMKNEAVAGLTGQTSSQSTARESVPTAP